LAHKFDNHDLWQLLEWHAMYVGPDSLLDCANGALYLPHMCIMQCEANSGWEEIVLHALESHVAVYVNDVETTCLIQLYCMLDLSLDSLFLLI